MNSDIPEKIEDCKDKITEDFKLEEKEMTEVKNENKQNAELTIKTEESEPMNELVENFTENKTGICDYSYFNFSNKYFKCKVIFFVFFFF